MLSEHLRMFYNGSDMREGVLCWYPFRQDASVLDLSGGALNHLLQSYCVSVRTGEEPADTLFDYIVAVDPEDFGVDALRSQRVKLSPRGRLLLAFENPFALRYWSGKVGLTGLPYDSLLGRDGRAGKTEMQRRLQLAGFEGQKWYYPLTDHWFTREVYSENYLPNEYLGQRFAAYMDYDANLRFDERPLYREVIRGGAFEFMCGAYLVEARACAEDEPCTVDYAAITAYREPSKRFATTVMSDGTVRKAPLHIDGQKSIADILRNHKELAALGINVIPLRLEGESIVMQRLDLPTLWDYWAKKLANGTFDNNEMFRQFDRIRDAIYLASRNGKCYWELVPANCFFDEQNDKLIFFDQEYYWDNHPPDLAVTRAIYALKYSAAFKAEPRSKGWLEALKDRYGLTGRWDELLELVKKTTAEVFGSQMSILQETTKMAKENIAGLRRRENFRPALGRLFGMGFLRPVIYGYGKWGRDFERVLKEAGMEPAAIADSNLSESRCVDEIIVDARADVVVVAIKNGAEIADGLRTKTELPVFTMEELLDGQTK